MPAFSLRSNPQEKHSIQVELNHILPGSFRARRSFDEDELRQLAESIRRYGLLNPLLVRKSGSNYELIAGERRLLALQMLGCSHAEVIVTAAFDRDCALMGLIENLQREELHFLDLADACRRILREHGLSREELAAGLCKSPSALANLLRLLKLDREARSFIRESGLGERHARALLKLQDGRRQLEFARRAAAEKLSVRQLEAIIETQPRKPGRTAGVIRDNRLVINALRDTVRQLKRIGVPASSRVETHADHYDIIITIRTLQAE